MNFTSVEMGSWLQQLYAQQLNVYGLPGQAHMLGLGNATWSVTAPVRRPSRADCEGCGAPTEAHRLNCRYCRRTYALEP